MAAAIRLDGVVRSASTEVGYVARRLVRRDEARHHYRPLQFAFYEDGLYETKGKGVIGEVMALSVKGFDETQRVEKAGVAKVFGYDSRG